MYNVYLQNAARQRKRPPLPPCARLCCVGLSGDGALRQGGGGAALVLAAVGGRDGGDGLRTAGLAFFLYSPFSLSPFTKSCTLPRRRLSVFCPRRPQPLLCSPLLPLPPAPPASPPLFSGKRRRLELVVCRGAGAIYSGRQGNRAGIRGVCAAGDGKWGREKRLGPKEEAGEGRETGG